MALLRARFKFNPGRHGAPLDRLGEFTAQAEKFLRSMAADVGVSPKKGDWLALNFKNSSVEFTAEYAKSLSDELAMKGQMAIDAVASESPMEAYNSGLVSVGTLAEFSKLSKSMQQDEYFQIGVLRSDEETEPSKWEDVSYTKLTNIRRLLELPLTTHGSVQGVIEVWHFSSSDGPFFVLRELGTGARVHCNYKAEIRRKIHVATQRENAVIHAYGRMDWERATNAIIKMDVDDVEEATPLTSGEFDSLFGSVPDFTGDMGTSDYLDWLRGDGDDQA
jgi:hypothetical protein